MKMVDFYKKTTNYWQAVLRVGLPIVVLYRVIHYAIFWIEGGKSAGLFYPWHFAVIVDVVTIFILSTIWWSLMRSGFGKASRRDTANEARDDKSRI
jgi:hypothetical protein